MSAPVFWVGTYGGGIYRTGPLQRVAEVASPSYLALHPHLPVLYAVSEEASRVAAYDVVSTGLRPAGTATVPAGPCHLVVHPDGRTLLSASYGAGTVNAHALDAAGRFTGAASVVPGHGSGPRTGRQDGPHAHAVAVAPDGTVLSTDLGADLLRAHRLDADGTLHPVADLPLPPGCGPRHLVVHPAGHVYVLTELARTVLVLRPGAGYADLAVVAESPAVANPADDTSLCAAIKLGGERFVYTSTRGADVITTYEVGEGGALRAVADTPCGGRWPRDLAVVGDRLYVAHEHSDTVATFALDPVTGVPTPTGATVDIPAPACVLPEP